MWELLYLKFVFLNSSFQLLVCYTSHTNVKKNELWRTLSRKSVAEKEILINEAFLLQGNTCALILIHRLSCRSCYTFGTQIFLRSPGNSWYRWKKIHAIPFQCSSTILCRQRCPVVQAWSSKGKLCVCQSWPSTRSAWISGLGLLLRRGSIDRKDQRFADKATRNCWLWNDYIGVFGGEECFKDAFIDDVPKTLSNFEFENFWKMWLNNIW